MRSILFLIISFFYGTFSLHSQADNKLVKQFCQDLEVKSCPSNLLIQRNKVSLVEDSVSKQLYVDFPQKLNFYLAARLIEEAKISNAKKRKAIQSLAINLNKKSVNNYVKKLNLNGERLPKTIEFVAVNNSSIFHYESPNRDDTDKEGNELKKNGLNENAISNAQEIYESERPIIAIVDSGVSLINTSMQEVEVFQFYPKQNNFKLVDTGLGHGTGIISLTDNLINQTKLGKPVYLSCVGLPHGKYQFIDSLKCLNWIFLKSKVDVVLNPWLASSPGCLTEWNYVFQMIWLSNSVPIFSAGNYGDKIEQNYSPANLSPFWPIAETISVGATDINQKRLASSSYHSIDCERSRSIATLNALGSGYRVAVPFTENSFQQVEGTSYAIVPVAIELLQLKKSFPEHSNAKLVSMLFNGSLNKSLSNED